MNTIKYISLYNYLTQVENQKSWEAIHSILRLRKMSPVFLVALNRIINGDTAVAAEEKDVSYGELVNDEGMLPTQALLMLDWIRRDPDAAMQFMSEEHFRSPIEPLTDEQTEKMKQALATFKERGLNVDIEEIPDSLEQLDEAEKQDIELNPQ